MLRGDPNVSGSSMVSAVVLFPLTSYFTPHRLPLILYINR